MTSSMLAGERKWASARRGGMTVLGKVAVPKPLNLPSQKLENHGLDPNVEIVPKGSLSWGSRPSSVSSNPWGSSAVSPNADGSTVSPHHSSGRPSSGGGLSRPSTAGSDRMHEPSASTWGPNSRPSSASGVLTSNQSSLTSSRPLSSETRPGSSHLSRFAEPAFDNSMAWDPNGTTDKLSIPSKVNDFSLSSGDFPSLGAEKDNTAKSSKTHDHGSHVRPGSSSGRTAPVKERNEMFQADPKSGIVETWTRDGPPHVEDGVRPSAEKWQGEPHQYVNPNVPPQHFDAWRGPPMNAPAGVWYRGPPPGPPYPPVPHGGFPMEHYPYYRSQIPPALANSQPASSPGPGPRGHHPRNGDFYRPQMPDAFIRPGMPIRPGFYPGPVPYDGYFGPPMGYTPNDRDIPFMGMPPGPPAYNMCPPQNPSGGRMFVSEQLDSVPPEESRGPYKVLRKRENERDAIMEEESWEHNTSANQLALEKSDQPRPSFHKNERGTNIKRNEDMPSRRNTPVENPSSRMIGNQGYPSDSVIIHSPEATHKSKIVEPFFSEVPHDISGKPKDPSLIQKIEGLNAKVRASDGYSREEQNNRVLSNPKDNSMVSFGSISNTDINALRGDNTSKSASASLISRQTHHGVRTRADHHSKGRSNSQDTDGWRKRTPILGLEVAASVSNQNVVHASTFQAADDHVSAEVAVNTETKNSGESLAPMVDPSDGQAQRARMKELAKQRAVQLQKEEEERIRDQKAKALVKLEELNRRTTLAADGATQTAEKTTSSVPEPEDAIKHEIPSSNLDEEAHAAVQISENSQQEPIVSHDQPLLSKQDAAERKISPLYNDDGLRRQKRVSHRQKQSVQMVESSVDKSTPSAVIKNSGSNVVVSGEAVTSQESSMLNTLNILPESTQQRKRNNKSSKNKHKLDDALPATVSLSSASKEGDLSKLSTESGKPESSQIDLDSSTVLATDGKDSRQSNLDQISSLPSVEVHGKATNQYSKPQNSRRMPRNPQANRSADKFHAGEAVVWAPVRAQNKEERRDEYKQDDVSLPTESVNSVQTNLKSKRAEMERYVPKPVAKELAQHGKSTLEDTTDKEESRSQPGIPVSVSVGSIVESKSGDNKQNKPVKSHGAWRQRGQTDSHSEHGIQQGDRLPSNLKENDHKSMSQYEVSNPIPTETNVIHEWDPSDGWFMPEYPPTEVAPVTSVVKDEGGVTGKGKRPAYKGQRSTVKYLDADHKDVSGTEVEKNYEINQTDRPASSKENRSSHWQPKPQAYRGGGQNANDGRNYASHGQPEELVTEYKNPRGPPHDGHQEGRRFEQHHASSGFRKYGGGQNNRSGGEDNRRQNNANVNRERQRQNLHYEYQPVGSNNISGNKSSNIDPPAEGSGNAAMRYKERGSGQSRRGGSNFYGQQ